MVGHDSEITTLWEAATSSPHEGCGSTEGRSAGRVLQRRPGSLGRMRTQSHQSNPTGERQGWWCLGTKKVSSVLGFPVGILCVSHTGILPEILPLT